MPTPAFFEAHAPTFWPYRWALGGGAIAIHLAMMGLLAIATETGLPNWVSFRPLFHFGALSIMWLWGLMLLGVWFHPTRGTTRPGSPWFCRVPEAVRGFFRWYASLFLALWFACGFFGALVILREAAA